MVILHEFDQDVKNAVALHEFMHCLGFLHNYDEGLTENTILCGKYYYKRLYNNGVTPQGFSTIDYLAILMLYNPNIPFGWSPQQITDYYYTHSLREINI